MFFCVFFTISIKLYQNLCRQQWKIENGLFSRTKDVGEGNEYEFILSVVLPKTN